MKTKPILIVDDESSMRMMLAESLMSCGYEVETLGNGTDALKEFQKDKFEIVITDMKMPGMSGTDLLRGIKEISPEVPVIIITAYGTVNAAVEAMKEGASDFIMKPFSLEHLELVVKRLIAENSGNGDGLKQKTQGDPLPGKTIITQDKKVLDILKLMKSISGSKASVLIQGESGTGKELIARYIHRHSDRADMPFVAINCAAIPDNLLESEMFGYERGAFTGATQRKPGKFEMADKGTLLLDEISEMEPRLQAKLLRVVQESVVDRLGGKDPVPVDVRIISTTNRDIKKDIAGKKFREDLFFRLNVMPVKIPPLRERRGDISVLCGYFLEKYGCMNGIKKPELSEQAMKMLEDYDWPGNVREIENVIERALLISGGDVILPEHLYLGEGEEKSEGDKKRQPAVRASETVAPENITLKELEKEMIFKTLEKTNGNKTMASKILDISVRTIRNKLNEYKNEHRTSNSEKQ